LASDNVQCIQVVEHVIQHMDIQSVKNHANLKLLLTPTSVVVTSHHSTLQYGNKLDQA
jgi:hypothetical protein